MQREWGVGGRGGGGGGGGVKSLFPVTQPILFFYPTLKLFFTYWTKKQKRNKKDKTTNQPTNQPTNQQNKTKTVVRQMTQGTLGKHPTTYIY